VRSVDLPCPDRPTRRHSPRGDSDRLVRPVKIFAPLPTGVYSRSLITRPPREDAGGTAASADGDGGDGDGDDDGAVRVETAAAATGEREERRRIPREAQALHRPAVVRVEKNGERRRRRERRRREEEPGAVAGEVADVTRPRVARGTTPDGAAIDVAGASESHSSRSSIAHRCHDVHTT
jgi:hypothetical protein